jgi:2-iminobutanoate/2-iminopropanoate deaminase
MKIKIETKFAPRAIGPYSQAIKIYNMVFTAGQIPLTTEGKLVEGTIEEQVHQTMDNLTVILKDAGVGFDNVVKTTIYVTDLSLFSRINEIYKSYFEDIYPARETVQVSALPKGAKLEISMIAVK